MMMMMMMVVVMIGGDDDDGDDDDDDNDVDNDANLDIPKLKVCVSVQRKKILIFLAL
jgi:hypothetical protein